MKDGDANVPRVGFNTKGIKRPSWQLKHDEIAAADVTKSAALIRKQACVCKRTFELKLNKRRATQNVVSKCEFYPQLCTITVFAASTEASQSSLSVISSCREDNFHQNTHRYGQSCCLAGVPP